jgi:hypothetical protein
MTNLRDLFWPTLEKFSADEVRRLHEREGADLEAIRVVTFGNASAAALEQARRIEADEEERKKTAETKASNFLLVVAALVPLLTYFESAVWEGKTGTAPKYLTLPLLSIAVAYLACAAFWAFRTVAVGAYHRVGIGDALDIITSAQPTERLAKGIMTATRRNQETLNLKISAAKMAHEFMLRAVLAFCFLLLLQAGFEIAATAGVWSNDVGHSVEASPRAGLVGPPGPAGPPGQRGESGKPGLTIRRVNAICPRGRHCAIVCDDGEIAVHAYCRTGRAFQTNDREISCSTRNGNEITAFCAK